MDSCRFRPAFDEKLGAVNGNVLTRDAIAKCPGSRHVRVFERGETWEVAVPPGFYDVWISVGDASYTQGSSAFG